MLTPLIAALVTSVKHPGGFADIKRRQIQTTLFIGSVQPGTSDRKKKRLPHIFASITSGKRTNRKCLRDVRKNLVGDCANPQSHISDGPVRFSTAQQCTAATCWLQAASAVAFSLNSGQSQLDQSESTSPTAGSSFTFTLTIEAAPLLKKRPLLQQQRRRPGSVPLQQAIVLPLAASAGLLLWFL